MEVVEGFTCPKCQKSISSCLDKIVEHLKECTDKTVNIITPFYPFCYMSDKYCIHFNNGLCGMCCTKEKENCEVEY